MWRSTWDWLLFVGGFVPALIFGVAVGNVIQGVPFYIDESLRPFYTGTFLELLNPFALASGLLSVVMLAMHGAFFIQIKTEGVIQQRAQGAGRFFAFLMFVLFIACGVWVYYGIEGYVLTSVVGHDGPSNPLYKHAAVVLGAWFSNYQAFPVLILVPVISLSSALLAMLFASWPRVAFVLSALSIGTLIATVGVSMFPFILPSSTNPDHSLIVWDSSSSHLTLWIMLVATVLLLPIILAYTAWVYRVLRGKVTEQTILDNSDSAY